MFGIIDTVLTMSADIYNQQNVQDEMTGNIQKEWHFVKTIDCHAKGIIGNSGTSRSGDKQIVGARYTYDQVIEFRTVEKISIRQKVTNICDSSGSPIWVELNYPTDTPTVFEVIGSTPMTDPFGNVVAYNSTLKRSENQQIGL